MRIEAQTEQYLMEKLLGGLKKAEFKGSLAEFMDIMKAADLIQRSVNDYKNPPKVSVPGTADEMGKKVLPMKLPPGSGKKKI